MISVSAELDARISQQALDWLAVNLGVTQRSAVYEFGRLAANDLMRRTPPLNNSMRLHQPTGRKAVESDIRKTVQSLEYYKQKGAKVFSLPGGRAGVKMPGGAYFTIPASRYDETGDRIAAHHEASRNPGTGRVAFAGVSDMLVVPKESMISKYVRSVWKRVGTLASSWTMAVLYCSPRSPVPNVPKIPKWVARHGNVMGSRIIDTLNARADKGELTFLAFWRYGSPAKYASLWRSVLRTREHDAMRWMRRRLEKLCHRFSGASA